MTLGVRAASIWLKVIVRYMYAALLHANVSPCAAPIGTMLCSQKRNVTCAAERGASCTPPTGVSGSSSSNSRSGWLVTSSTFCLSQLTLILTSPPEPPDDMLAGGCGGQNSCQAKG